jgi:hypothetical protein
MDRRISRQRTMSASSSTAPASRPVVIMSVQDFIRTTAPPPDWLQKAWTGAKQRGLDKLTPADIDAEIHAYQRKPDL